eukprot:6356182-Pyramimonas_sp.AAC.1
MREPQQRVAVQGPPADLRLLSLGVEPLEVVRHRRVCRLVRAEAAHPASCPSLELADLRLV